MADRNLEDRRQSPHAVIERLGQELGECRVTGESGYRALWHEHAADAASPLLMAVAGGVCADRLAWVFLAGYQAAVRQAFAISASGWLAFVASEDRSEEQPLPGVTLRQAQDGMRLNGFKTWVAAVDHVDELVVLVGRRGGSRCFRVERNRPGLTLSARPAGSFLAELSQGQAEFAEVSVSDRDELQAGNLGSFPRQEAGHIYAAFLACAMTRAWGRPVRADCAELLARAEELASAELAGADALPLLKSLDSGFRDLVRRVETLARSEVPGWSRDARLLEMYSRGIEQS